MNRQPSQTLLAAHDAAPVRFFNSDGRSPFLLIGDHAGNAVPSALGTLGIADDDRARHIGWDIGVGGLGPLLADRLDAVWLSQSYSRLVIDCNRDPVAPDAIPEVSDGTPIPGNIGLSSADRAARVADIHASYHQAIADEIARRDASGLDTILVALHSFTPVWQGEPRPWHAGVLHDGGDSRFAIAMLHALAARDDLIVGDNEPYAMDRIDYTIPRHAYPLRRAYVELEIRQDLLATPSQQQDWAEILAETLDACREQLR